jgi:hypothetical protein
MFVTNHAKKRMAERLGFNKRSCDRIAARAMDLGYSIHDVSNDARRWMLSHWYQTTDSDGTHMRMYGSGLYMFNDEYVLLTVLPVPSAIIHRIAGHFPKRKHVNAENDYDYDTEEIIGFSEDEFWDYAA